MDQQSTVTAFSELIRRFPDLNMTVVADIMEACGHDFDRAYATVYEMVTPPENAPSERNTDQTSVIASVNSQKDSPPRVRPPVHYAFEDAGVLSTTIPPVRGELMSAQHVSLPDVSPRPVAPREATPSALQGAWASKNMGRRIRVDEMCNKYTWIGRPVVEDLFDRFGDCLELVENEILHMFPIDEPAAFADTPKPRPRPRGVGQARKRVMAESLRAQAVEEIRRSADRGTSVSMKSAEMQAMRRQLWETREERGRLLMLANQTRKKELIDKAKEKEQELQHLSDTFLDNIRRSEEYRNGVIDVHGLTKEEAIQIVEWKLQESGRKRFRLITGKGNHSHNYQAVLKPALEKHFRSKRVAFSQLHDGVLSVSFP